MDDPLVQAWRNIVVGDKSWVLFKHGTCVVMARPVEDPVAQATALLREWGPVHAGTPAGDFDVVQLEDGAGWVVTSHHPDIRTYVGADEFDDGQPPEEVIIGLIGRGKRDRDPAELQIIHTEA